MKAIMVMYDSLNRHFLPGYGCDLVPMPNFERLAKHTVQFDACYVGSLPCMPARRELHTGRYNFLHRSWGPLEPFDASMPQILKQNGVRSHLTTDHYHYFEDGGCTYHNRYSTYANARGQESDCFGTTPDNPAPTQMLHLDKLPDGFRQYRARTAVQNMRNRERTIREEEFPQAQTFADGLRYLDENYNADRWFLQIETFDPHEPFFTPENIQKAFFDPDHPLPPIDCPCYGAADETPEEIEIIRKKYMALLTMCDKYLGKVLDKMDEYDLWKDTMLIVNTDHGFLLSEHGWWGKSVMPTYNELANIPLYIWDPRCGKAGETRSTLVQTIDLAPTLLEYFGVAVPASMQGKPLTQAIAQNTPVRDAALFGYFGDHVNITDGRYVYMRAPRDAEAELNEYTLMPTHMNGMFRKDELKDASLVNGGAFAGDTPVLKIPVHHNRQMQRSAQDGDLLFDLVTDPHQNTPIRDEAQEIRLAARMVELLKESDAPAEQFARLGLTQEA